MLVLAGCSLYGENLTIRAQALAKEDGLRIDEAPAYRRDELFWLPGNAVHNGLIHPGRGYGPCFRSHYYTSTTGDQDKQNALRERLRGMGFEPRVFHRDKGTQRSKGVDIALATELLGHAFRGNFDAVVLVAGDADYLPLIEEVKRLGRIVQVQFFEKFTRKDFRLAPDCFEDLTPLFRERLGKL